MIAVVFVRMGMYPARAVVQNMGGNDQHHSRCQQPGLELNIKLFQHQEYKAGNKEGKG